MNFAKTSKSSLKEQLQATAFNSTFMRERSDCLCYILSLSLEKNSFDCDFIISIYKKDSINTREKPVFFQMIMACIGSSV